jgi:glucose/mannose transport system substrate-binding protein
MNLSSRSSIVALALAFSAIACGSGADDGDEDNQTGTQNIKVEVFSWWTAPGETEALQSLIKLHQNTYPNSRIYNAATDPKVTSGGDEAKVVLQQRLEDGDPPDAFQTNAFELKRGYLAASPELLQPLDDLFDEEGLTGSMAPEPLRDVTIDGHVLAVPVNVHRENGLFYNMDVFNRYDLAPPTTVAEFLDVCETLKAEGVTPLAISTSQSWIINKVFVSFALATMGPDEFTKYFVDKEPATEEAFAPAIALLDQVLTDYIDVEGAAVDGYGWTQAADSLHRGEAGMFIHGDWAKGYLTQLGWTPGLDFGVVATPDSGGAFLYGMDVFAVPAGAPHPADALDWVRTIASPEGQVAFNEIKGSSPVRLNVPEKGLDTMARGVYADFKASEKRIPAIGLPAAWDEGFGKLAKEHDQAALLQTFIDNPLADAM